MKILTLLVPKMKTFHSKLSPQVHFSPFVPLERGISTVRGFQQVWKAFLENTLSSWTNHFKRCLQEKGHISDVGNHPSLQLSIIYD